MNVFRDVFTRLLASKMTDIANLEEGTPMENSKPWYKSKTIWSDVATMLLTLYAGISETLAPHMGWHLPPVPGWLMTILGTLLGVTGVAGRVTATTTIAPEPASVPKA